MTIIHLRKMTESTIQVQHLLQRNNDCNGYYSKTTVQIILFVVYYLVRIERYAMSTIKGAE